MVVRYGFTDSNACEELLRDETICIKQAPEDRVSHISPGASPLISPHSPSSPSSRLFHPRYSTNALLIKLITVEGHQWLDPHLYYYKDQSQVSKGPWLHSHRKVTTQHVNAITELGVHCYKPCRREVMCLIGIESMVSQVTI